MVPVPRFLGTCLRPTACTDGASVGGNHFHIASRSSSDERKDNHFIAGKFRLPLRLEFPSIVLIKKLIIFARLPVINFISNGRSHSAPESELDRKSPDDCLFMLCRRARRRDRRRETAFLTLNFDPRLTCFWGSLFWWYAYTSQGNQCVWVCAVRKDGPDGMAK